MLILIPPFFNFFAVGHNDICTHPCNTSYTAFDASPPFYRQRVAQALDMLRDNLPRLELAQKFILKKILSSPQNVCQPGATDRCDRLPGDD